MMVPQSSAIHLGASSPRDKVPIEADHSGMVKFSHISNHEYVVVESRIRDLVENSAGVISQRFSLHKKSNNLRMITPCI
jgi:hypothetical protein